MSALATYRRLFSLTGPGYLLIAFLGRLPLAMSQMGTLILVREFSGSYGAGGAAAGALAIANAIGSPVAGNLADRYGQRPILVVQSIVGSLGLTALVVLSGFDVQWQLLAVVAAFTGIFLPQVGALARVRWRELAKSSGAERPLLVSTAFSYEGAADEASFVFGPALIGFFVAIISPAGALICAAILLITFGLWFGVHPTTSVVRGHRGAVSLAKARIRPILIGLAAGQLIVGIVFGSVQTGTTALATAEGQPGWAGYLQALLGVGSVVAGLLLAVLPASWLLANRLPVFAGGLALMAAPLLLVNSVLSLAIVLIILGLAVAPYMITLFAACEQVTEAPRLGAAMMVLAAATSLGYALGSSVAGRVADSGGYAAAYWVTVTAAALAFVLALVLRVALLRTDHATEELPAVA